MGDFFGELVAAVFGSAAFGYGLSVFIGVVAGAFIQHGLNYLTFRSQRQNALRALRAEIEMNVEEYQYLRKRLVYLKERIAAGQITEADLFVSMQNFDYSIIGPLVNQGYFHVLLGPDLGKRYFSFMRFFNNANCNIINSMLRTEHEQGKSLDYIDGLLDHGDQLAAFAVRLGKAEVRAGRLQLPDR